MIVIFYTTCFKPRNKKGTSSNVNVRWDMYYGSIVSTHFIVPLDLLTFTAYLTMQKKTFIFILSWCSYRQRQTLFLFSTCLLWRKYVCNEHCVCIWKQWSLFVAIIVNPTYAVMMFSKVKKSFMLLFRLLMCRICFSALEAF